MTGSSFAVRRATVADAGEVGRLLHDFNREFDTPTPGAQIIARRARTLLEGDSTFAILAGDPAVGIALVTLRPNVWFDGPVALLDELYVAPSLRDRSIGTAIIEAVRDEARRRGVDLIEINVDESDTAARRFYERLGFSGIEPDTGEAAIYYHGTAATPAPGDDA